MWRYQDSKPGEPGVYEFHVKARISGRASGIAETEVKTVEGALRIVIVPQKIGMIDTLRKEHESRGHVPFWW